MGESHEITDYNKRFTVGHCCTAPWAVDTKHATAEGHASASRDLSRRLTGGIGSQDDPKPRSASQYCKLAV